MSKTHKRNSKNIRVSVDYPWIILSKIISDIRSQNKSVVVDGELKKLESFVRMRDIKAYITACKTRWALKSLIPLADAIRRECPGNLSYEVRCLRFIRILTIFQKYRFQNTPFNTKANALTTFLQAEEQCRRTNKDRIFQSYKIDDDDPLLTTYDNLYTVNVLRYAREFIQRVIGVAPDIEMFFASLRHGPGASTDKRGNHSIPIEKFLPPIGCSPMALPYFSSVLDTDQLWKRAIRDLWCNSAMDKDICVCRITENCDSSLVTFVPKDAEKDRTINIEPTANVYMQLAVDKIIRTNLKRFSIDLDTQERNQSLARHGSLANDIVTIDLSSASDTVASVWLELFPEKWKKLLNSLRMHRGQFADGTTVHFSKLSAMGNGFTFCIESLLFSAILYGTIRVRNEKWKDHIDLISIYGDDIIIPSVLYAEYSYFLRRFGFKENAEKSFSFGPIRESCGKDYYYGHDIHRPTIKERPIKQYELCIDHNILYDVAIRYSLDLSNTLQCIKHWAVLDNYDFGPYDPQDFSCWFFSEEPTSKASSTVWYQGEKQQYQALYFKVRRNVIGHPVIKKSHDSPLRYFLPLMYLNRTKTPTDKSICTNVNRDRTKSSILCFLDSIGFDRGRVETEFFFIKKKIVVRTAMARVPYYKWTSA